MGAGVKDLPAPLGARCGGIVQIRGLFQIHLGAVPCDKTIRKWLDQGKVPRFKANPLAKFGGGPCYYSLSHVERLLRSRMIPGKVN